MTSFTLIRKVNIPVEKVWEKVGDFTKSPGPVEQLSVHKNILRTEEM